MFQNYESALIKTNGDRTVRDAARSTTNFEDVIDDNNIRNRFVNCSSIFPPSPLFRSEEGDGTVFTLGDERISKNRSIEANSSRQNSTGRGSPLSLFLSLFPHFEHLWERSRAIDFRARFSRERSRASRNGARHRYTFIDARTVLWPFYGHLSHLP